MNCSGLRHGPASRASFRAKARTKTFTGCWTCRQRRLKCDEARPECAECRRKGLPCGGYGARLQWLPPNSDYDDRRASIRKSERRRRLLPLCSLALLTDAEIESAIKDVDDASRSEEANSYGPFSAFKLEAVSESRETPIPRQALRNDAQRPSDSDLDSSGEVRSTTFVENEPRAVTLNAETPQNDEAMQLQIMDGDASAVTSQVWPEQVYGGPLNAVHLYRPRAEISEVSSSTTELQLSSTSRNKNFSTTGSLLDIVPFRPSFITSQVRHLLDHYRQHVMYIYTMLDNENTPWHNIHIPRVFQGCTEMEVVGKSSPARSALLHAILSVSAYNLQNRHLLESRTDHARNWEEIGLSHRAQALNALRASASDPSPSWTSSQYKELLAAMLSMVTVDVVSGDTETCKIHLDGCESLIRARRRTGAVDTSAKIKALHRIFLYLRIIQEAMPTASNTQSTYDTFEFGAHDIYYQTGSDDLESYLDLPKLTGDEYDSSSWELIYGLPQSLIMLVRKTSKLIGYMHRGDAFINVIPDVQRIVYMCDDLEDQILNFPIEEMVARFMDANLNNHNRIILQHHVRAFHNALIIYFSSRVRRMHRRYLQHYVKTVIDHLEKIEEIKSNAGIVAQPILWPVFTAASQALDPSTRSQYLHYLNRAEIHGVGVATRARRVLEEAWRNDGDEALLREQKYLMLA